MNAIMGMAGLLLDTSLDQEQRDYVQIIRSSSDALLGVINDVLDFSKVEANKLELEQLDFDLRNAVDEMISIPAMAAERKGLEFCYSLADNIPALLIGDPGRLRQIIINLTNNAIKFTKEGEVELRGDLVHEDEESVLLRFSVRDTGIGISDADQSKLFGHFSQVDASSTRLFGGTGLGLAITKRLAGLMDGEVGVRSEAGRGSTFWFTARFGRQAAQPPLSLIPAEDLLDKRILVVDDNHANLRIMEGYLGAWGFASRSVDGADAALVELRRAYGVGEPYDVVLTDWQMPEVDGAELGRRIKADPELAHLVLVILSSRGLRGDAARMRETGFAGYLVKPIGRSQLFDCIVMVLNQEHERSIALSATAPPQPRLVTRHALSDAHRQQFRILVVEDNVINQKLALKLLEKAGLRGCPREEKSRRSSYLRRT